MRLVSGSQLATAASDWLVRPLDAARAAGGGEVCACLNRQFEPVREAFQKSFEGAYPFNRSSQTSASRAEVAQFFSSTGGIFAFEDNEAKAAREAGVSLSGDYEAAIDIARRISAAMPGGHISVAFSLTASSVNMKEIKLLRLEYGSSVWEYAMGMSVDRQFKWPTPGYDRASLSITPTNQNLYAQPVKYDGEWALLQLFDAATISGSMVSWDFSTQSGPTLIARLELSGESADFIRSGHFSNFRCPTSACH